MNVNRISLRKSEEKEERTCIDRGTPCNRFMESLGSTVEGLGRTWTIGMGVSGALWAGVSFWAYYDVTYTAATAARIFAIPLFEGVVVWVSGYGIRKTAEMP